MSLSNLIVCLPVALASSCASTNGDALTASMYGYPADADYAVAATAYDTGLYGYDTLYSARARLSSVDDPIGAIRAAAIGVSDMCPGAVEIEPKITLVPCALNGAAQPSQTGVAINFNHCQLGNGGVLTGMLDSAATHAASDEACDSRTAITVTYSATFSNFSYVAPSGRISVLRSLTANGRFVHALGELPRNIAAEIDASIQRYDADSRLMSDRSLSGTLSASMSHALLTTNTEGMLTASNQLEGSSAAVQVEGLQYEASCCHAITGKVSVSGGENQSVEFGPGCGEASLNRQPIALHECP